MWSGDSSPGNSNEVYSNPNNINGLSKIIQVRYNILSSIIDSTKKLKTICQQTDRSTWEFKTYQNSVHQNS